MPVVDLIIVYEGSVGDLYRVHTNYRVLRAQCYFLTIERPTEVDQIPTMVNIQQHPSVFFLFERIR